MTVRDLEQAIDTTRDDLDQTLRALQSRLSPTRRLKAAWGATRVGSAGVVRGGITWAVSHPGAVVVLATVVALALRSTLQSRTR